MICDGVDLKYLLEKKGYSFSNIARNINVTPQHVFRVVRGYSKSERVIRHIEDILSLVPGELEIISPKYGTSIHNNVMQGRIRTKRKMNSLRSKDTKYHTNCI